MSDQQKPAIVAHCDWSMAPKKRWMTVANNVNGTWHISLPELVGPTKNLLAQIKKRASGTGPIFMGFDFPIGLPEDYGQRTGLADFPTALRAFGSGEWDMWFEVCERAEEISIHRPFYPMRPGGTKREHLLTGLDVKSTTEILRHCDKKTADRQAACSLFWTLGGNQVGKGAISGWKEVLQPNIDEIGLWPFDGSLDTLFHSEEVVIAETYPGEVYTQIGSQRRPVWSKRKQEGRAAVAGPILDLLDRRDYFVHHSLRELVASGFSSTPVGEDQFDATVGLLGMLEIVDHHRSEGCPSGPGITQWEGWILGQSSS